MKKLSKILLCVLLCGLLALAICYMAIPERTKESVDIVVGYLNTPIGLACGSVVTIGGVLTLCVKLIGKYLIDNNKINLDTHKEEMNALVEKSKDYETKALNYYNNTKDIMKDFCERMDILSNEIVKVCETSPNAKIKALGEEFKNKTTEYKEELKHELAKIDNGLETIMERKPSVEELENKIKELTEKVESLVVTNEREEEING